MLLAVFSVAVFLSSGLCCLPKEYEARDGQCCPMCHEGSVVKRDCIRQYRTRCISCVDGTFMNKPNSLNKCSPCTSCDQGHGLLTQQTCTATTDTLCDVVSGYFCKVRMEDTGTGCSLAQKHRQCGPGYRTLEPGKKNSSQTGSPFSTARS
ncbi:tumor necrosis factor receptor superfamily member 14-like [Clinocottus analis]|uniref:tumor necrosis factor receptor superfamily member 14-like n=1 Tax=Clinocottus analis TaxID=304258 RepID=UPI0035C03509